MFVAIACTPALGQVNVPSKQVAPVPGYCYKATLASWTGQDCYSSAGAAVAAAVAYMNAQVYDGGSFTYWSVYTVVSIPDLSAVSSGTARYTGQRCYSNRACDPVDTTISGLVGKTKVADSCPANAEMGGGTCWCSAGFQPDGTGTACVPQCQVGNVLSSGYYDIGTNAQATPLLWQCKNGCGANFDGESPAGSAMVDNTKHWYAKGQYLGNGIPCTTPSNAPEGLQVLPADSCDPAKYDKGTFNGKTICTLKGTNTPATPAPSASSSSSSNSTTTNNSDGSTTTKETSTTTAANGSSTTTTTTTTTNPDGSKSSNTVVVTTPSPTSDDDEKTACEKNPSDKGCGGSAATIGSSWTSKTAGKSFSSVVSGFVGKVGGTPLVTATRGFFTVSTGGSCPTWSTSVPYLNMSLDFTAFCSSTAMAAYLVVRAVLLVLASWLAFRIALDN
ncbi:hypothetical protein [Roseateles sp. YR242]|uniref:hypothetical protein n=1 Tax=Roseateles sp. YR242 TaxID=1855305 RepID=UPI0011602507|nr:hypothetical protein [Roseateles sp. YR242]